MKRPRTRVCWVVPTAALMASGLPSAYGEINLVWEPEAQTVNVGDTVQIGLFAVSDDETDQAIGAMQVILGWEPEHLTLTGELANGPYDWWGDFGLISPDPGGLNDTWADGDAFYIALSDLNPPLAFATPEGLLVTTFEFIAEEATAGTELSIPWEFNGIHSKVLDGVIPGLDVTGLLGSANVTIVPEPITVLLFGFGVGGLACGRWCTGRHTRPIGRGLCVWLTAVVVVSLVAGTGARAESTGSHASAPTVPDAAGEPTAGEGCEGTVSAVFDIRLSPVVEEGPLNRCIEFEFFDCDTDTSVVILQEIQFGGIFSPPGLAQNVEVEVPCVAGFYDCASARDPLHTLRSFATDFIFDSNVGVYTGIFNGTDSWLIGGNLNDDTVIDISDFGAWLGAFMQPGPSDPDTNCNDSPVHADITGDGWVDVADYTFVLINFFDKDPPNCCTGGAPITDPPAERISLADLERRGLGELSVADLNEDGYLDVADMLLASEQFEAELLLPVRLKGGSLADRPTSP